jgi:pimeloyl-ACP methyl ester carboxylesterase
MTWALTAVAALVALVAISHVVEALRSQPTPPQHLVWAPDIPVRYLEAAGMKLRYITTGQGPALVLLHTLRTQLDMFQKVVPKLGNRFRVYALDYPGHGFSSIPKVEYSVAFFVDAVAQFLDRPGASLGASN